jgi:hypothetical protein
MHARMQPSGCTRYVGETQAWVGRVSSYVHLRMGEVGNAAPRQIIMPGGGTYRPTVSESPTTHKCRFGRVMATATGYEHVSM